MKKGLMIIIFISFIFFGQILLINAGEGGATVPINSISLTDKETDYNMKPGRLTFEFNEKLYAIQLRKIKEGYATFLIMTLDKEKTADITAYTLDDSFNLLAGETREIDLDKDGINDLVLGLNNLDKINRIKSASFSIEKINNKKEENNTEIVTSIITGNVIQEPKLEQTIILEPLQEKTFFDKIINWIGGIFK